MNNSKLTKSILAVVAVAMLAVPGFVQASDWSHEIELYMMAVTIEGDAGIGRADGADVDVDFDDILDALNAAAMVHYEAHHKSGWGLILDYAFMDLRDDLSGPSGGVADVEVFQGVFQADVMYRVSLAGGTLDYLGGVRWWDNNLEVNVDAAVLPGSVSRRVSEDWVDVFVGARWIQPINQQWDYLLRGDVGGFGLEADFTSSLAGGLRYKLTEALELDMQYKATWVDYESGSKGEPGYFAYDTVTHGPVLGLIYKL
jgi:hypothetical protein